MSGRHQIYKPRPLGNKRPRTLFFISVEGAQTEPSYFKSQWCKGLEKVQVILIKPPQKGGGNAPNGVLDRLETEVRRKSPRHPDEAWLVVDRDGWTDKQLDKLYFWSKKKSKVCVRGLALSNPKFEYWLLLHFGEYGRLNSKACSRALQKHMPNYDKDIPPNTISRARAIKAIERAKKRDDPPCEGLPQLGVTTVYRLVERILELEGRKLVVYGNRRD